jgi:hypothetical protein
MVEERRGRARPDEGLYRSFSLARRGGVTHKRTTAQDLFVSDRVLPSLGFCLLLSCIHCSSLRLGRASCCVRAAASEQLRKAERRHEGQDGGSLAVRASRTRPLPPSAARAPGTGAVCRAPSKPPPHARTLPLAPAASGAARSKPPTQRLRADGTAPSSWHRNQLAFSGAAALQQMQAS